MMPETPIHPLSWLSKMPEKGTRYYSSYLSDEEKCDE